MTLKQIGIFFVLEVLISCSTIPPYQRGKLADPILNPDEGNVSRQMEEKTLFIQEGTKKMGSGSGGGCGC